MASQQQYYIPVAPRNGGEVHATSLSEAGKTVCGHEFRGWAIRPAKLTCKRCRELLHMPVKSR